KVSNLPSSRSIDVSAIFNTAKILFGACFARNKGN
ncbi:hypothetical protein SMU109_06336, partial [Streptococcus mutans OMZ175]